MTDNETLSGALRDARRFIDSFRRGDFGAHEYKTVQLAREHLATIEAALAAQPEAVTVDGIPVQWQQGYDQGFNDGMFAANKIAAAPTPAAVGQGEAVGPLDLSAPPKVWLQIDTMGDDEDRSEAIPRDCWGDLTWCYESIGGQEVVYIRADLTHPAAVREVDDATELHTALMNAAGAYERTVGNYPNPRHRTLLRKQVALIHKHMEALARDGVEGGA